MVATYKRGDRVRLRGTVSVVFTAVIMEVMPDGAYLIRWNVFPQNTLADEQSLERNNRE